MSIESKSKQSELSIVGTELDNLPVVVGIKIDSLKTAVTALEHHRKKFAHWKLRHPQSAQEFQIAAENIRQIEQYLTHLDHDHSDLLIEVKVLRNSLAELKTKSSNLEDLLMRESAKRERLEQEFEEFKIASVTEKLAAERETERKESIIKAFDLIRMYRFYYAESIVGDWKKFCEQFYKFEDEVFHGRKTQSEFDAFLKPFDDQLVSGLSFAQIMKMTDERHAIAHTDIRSAANQKAFLEECSVTNFADVQANSIACKVIPELQKISLRRMN